jgi:hypothetical protein
MQTQQPQITQSHYQSNQPHAPEEEEASAAGVSRRQRKPSHQPRNPQRSTTLSMEITPHHPPWMHRYLLLQ